jgi:hypothetical protein
MPDCLLCAASQYWLPNAPAYYNATLSVNGSSLYLQGAQIYSNPERLNWLGGDLFQASVIGHKIVALASTGGCPGFSTMHRSPAMCQCFTARD